MTIDQISPVVVDDEECNNNNENRSSMQKKIFSVSLPYYNDSGFDRQRNDQDNGFVWSTEHNHNINNTKNPHRPSRTLDGDKNVPVSINNQQSTTVRHRYKHYYKKNQHRHWLKNCTRRLAEYCSRRRSYTKGAVVV
jgi:hypothetical protein